MSVDNFYQGNLEGKQYIGIDYVIDFPQKDGKRRWLTESDIQRIKQYEENKRLFFGKHYEGDGGIWPHPMGKKGIIEGIPYRQVNILGNATSTFSNLIVGDGIKYESKDFATKDALDLVFENIPLEQALNQTSYYGWVGLQPVKKQLSINKFVWSFDIINPSYLFPEYKGSNLHALHKRILFKNVQVSNTKKMDILLQETHLRGMKINKLYQVKGEWLICELSLDYYKFIDNDGYLEEIVETHLEDFEIQILPNLMDGNDFLSDYTITAKRNQRSFNDAKTGIWRILKTFANPKMIAPISAVQKDPATGESFYGDMYKEVLFFDDKRGVTKDAYSYLTWNGELSEQRQNLSTEAASLLAELQISPVFMNLPDLIGMTTADTAEKIILLTQNTIKKVEKKRSNFRQPFINTLWNIMTYSGIENIDFSIQFPEMLPKTRTELLNEIAIRKQNNLITTERALMMLDNLTPEQAQAEAVAIHDEATTALSQDSFFQNTVLSM